MHFLSIPLVVLLLPILSLCWVSIYKPVYPSRYFAANKIKENPKESARINKYQKLMESVDYKRADTTNAISVHDDPLLPYVNTAILAADSRKATSISAFRVSHMTEVTTFLVVIEGNSRPQNQAIATSVEDDLLENYKLKPSKQGDVASGWIVLDYGYLIVHVMTPQLRAFYRLESRWKNADVYDVATYLAEMSDKKSDSNLPSKDGVDENRQQGQEDDPFWK